jgi:hypothetical protein
MRTAARALSVVASLCALKVFATLAKKMTAPAKSTRDLLEEGWQWRKMAWSRHDEIRIFEWAIAFNTLLDQLLEERPDLRVDLD